MRPTYPICLLGAAISLSSLSPSLAAQTVEEEDVTVTGVRQAYTGNFAPLETPQANQIIDSELLVDTGALNLNDALDLSATVSRQNNFGGLWNSFSVRGFSGDINLPSGFLVNGFNAGRGYGGPRDLAGIESVEILKGPRAALFGRGEPGGTINLVTKRPEFENGGYVQGTIGSWDQYRLEADVQAAVGDQLGLRLVGFGEDAESFREGFETEKTGFYPSVTYKPFDAATITYEIEYTNQETPFDRGVVYDEDFGFSPRNVFVGENVPIETEVLGNQLEVELAFSDNWSLLTGLGYRDTSFEGDAFEPQFGSRQTYFQDGETIARFYRARDFDSEHLVARSEISGEFETGALSHRLIVGVDYDEFDNTLVIDRYRSRFNGDINNITDEERETHLLLNVNDPVYGLNLNPDAGPNTSRTEVLKGYGVYIQEQIDVGDFLQIRLGGRFDDFEQDLTNWLAEPSTIISAEDDRFSPQAGIVFPLGDRMSLYASYGEGFRLQSGQDFQGNQFEPNVTESTEVGFKADFAGLSRIVEGLMTVSLFQVDQSNFLVNDDRPEATAVGFFSIAAGEARSQGLELDTYLKLENNVNFWLSYAYTDAEFRNTFADADGFGFTIDAGDPLINVPEHQLSVQVSQDREIRSTNVSFGGGFLYVDDRNGFVGSDFELPDYVTARLFAEVEPIQNITLRFDIDNLFDETFYTNSFADVWVEPGTERRYRLTGRYRF